MTRLSICFSGLVLAACGAPANEMITPQEAVQIYSRVVRAEKSLSGLVESTDPLAREQWHFRNTGQSSARGIRGQPGADIRLGEDAGLPNNPTKDVVIAVIDSGLDQTHEDLDLTRLAHNPGESGLDQNGHDRSSNGKDDDNNGLVDDHTGWNFAEHSPETTDTLGHGTHVAGLMMARSENALGVRVPWPKFKVLPLQIFSSKRPAPTAETIAAAIRYAVQRGAQVISASFGTPTPSQSMRHAIELALQNDVLFVSAVGNFRQNQDVEPSFPAGFNLANQISVGASERRDLAATFSNFGSKVDLFAPGEEILSLGLKNSFVIRSGTSQAAPLVAAAAATARQLYPDATAVEIKKLVVEAADELPGLTNFSHLARRLNVTNIIHKRSGMRKEKFDFEKWNSRPINLETEHPYRADVLQEIPINAPENSRFLRLEFSHFSTQSTDTLEILDNDNRVIALLSGSLGSFWTPVYTAQKLTLRFSSDAYVSDFGWKIARIQYTE